MTPERWRQITAIFHAALAREAADRDAYVVSSCGDDAAMQREVASMLAAHLEAGEIGELGSYAGTRLGPYEVVSLLGVGGMGAVYRARDTKLHRDVAVKVLLPAVAGDPERLGRFTREARVLASLNHPHIAQVHGLEESDGVRALVMELVEGPTLEDRITQGAIAIDDALPIARQIAEALEAAHEHGIVHRDLKPANIKVRVDGTVKVLDFGLAKALDPAGASGANATTSPTLSMQATQAGVILGTAAYMAPEQARGKVVDRRADIWAFGCVLYEMLTGRRAFDADDIVATLAAVISTEPDWAVLPAPVPTPIRRLLRRCLEKDLKRRLPDIAVARLEIDDALMRSSDDAAAIGARETGEPRTRWRGLVPLVAVGTLMAVLGGLATWALTRPAPPRLSPSSRFAITLPAAQSIASRFDEHVLALSPEGTHLVYIAGAQAQLMLRSVERLDADPLPGIVGARGPFFSPDGRAIGFFDNGGALRRVSVTGGPPIVLCRVSGTSRGASWGPDDTIVFATSDTSSGLLSVPAMGGEPKVLTKPAQGEQDHFFPSVLPGGRSVLFTVVAGVRSEPSYVATLDLETGDYKRLLRGGRAEYVDTGHLIYEETGTIWAVRFDLATQRVLGDPVPVVQRLAGRNFSVSRQGTLVYTPARAPGGPLMWVSREGHEDPISAPPRAYLYPRLSPDESRVAARVTEQELHIWTWDFSTQQLTRLTLESGETTYPLWAGDHIIFTFVRSGAPNLWRRRADGGGTAERLTTSPRQQNATAISPDGKRLVYQELMPDTGHDLKLLWLDGTLRSEPLLETPANERNAELSPDGRWLAYESDETGTMEIYVRPFPDVAARKIPISSSGGRTPVWAASGRELFFVNGTSLFAVEVQLKPTFAARKITKLFDSPTILFDAISGTGTGRTYDVSRNGDRFLMLKAGGASTNGDAPADMVVVQNWLEELKRLVPTK
jgi:eukaryotic-like serine/threonine-protein kinase